MVWWYGCPSGNFDPIRKEVVMRGATRSGSGKRNGRWRALPSALLAVQLAVPLSAIQGAHAESATPVGQQMGSKYRSEEHTSELQSRGHLVCRLLLEKKNEEGDANGYNNTY